MLPVQIEKLINDFTEQSKTILKDNLVGVYLHGSAVMGCFNPKKSDLDLIVVVERTVPDIDKRSFMDMVIRLNSSAPAKGIEMSMVLRSVCKPFVYPTPFELHFSEMHLKWYEDAPEDYISKMKGEDTDLAAHFTILVNRGRCIYGAPIEEVFSEVPAADYMDSIWDDVAEAPEDISDNTMYLTLNLARVLAYKQEKLILSKKEGGEWAIGNLPEEYRPLINEAMKEYMEGVTLGYDMNLAKKYAEHVLARIKE
jgi:streptomycin 3"-adenylyltransferase